MTTVQAVKVAEAEPAGLDMSKLNVDELDRAIGALKLKPIMAMKGPEHRARALSAHYAKVTKRDDLAVCTNCGGTSPDALDVCPFCAYSGDAEDPDAVRRGEREREEGSRAMVVVAKQPPAIVHGHKASEKDLDDAVAHVHRLKAIGAISAWELGKQIDHIYTSGLWMLRLNETGKQRWKNSEAFCHAELAMSPQNARQLARVSREYDKNVVAQFGTKKLMLSLQAPSEVRPRIIEEIKKGKTKREVEKIVREATAKIETTVLSVDSRLGKAGDVVTKGGRQIPPEQRVDQTKAEREVAAAAVPKPPAKMVTVANLVGVQTVPLFKRASMNPKDPNPKEGARAKKINDDPWGYLDLANGVRMTFRVMQTPAGLLQLKVETKREDA
jgi:hypothetical protein